MPGHSRFKNKVISKLVARFPRLARRIIDAYVPEESQGIPWTRLEKPLNRSSVALVTTAGVHRRDQPPFDMLDKDGDPSFREIKALTRAKDLMITHDYYDHGDADRDVNIVFPLERLQEFAVEGIIGEVAGSHYGFMGHITGAHVRTLTEVSAPRVAAMLKAQEVDCVLLTPG